MTSSPTLADRPAQDGKVSDGLRPRDRSGTAPASTSHSTATATTPDRPTPTPSVPRTRSRTSGGKKPTCMWQTTFRTSWNVSAVTSLRPRTRTSSKPSWTARSRVCVFRGACSRFSVLLAFRRAGSFFAVVLQGAVLFTGTHSHGVLTLTLIPNISMPRFNS